MRKQEGNVAGERNNKELGRKEEKHFVDLDGALAAILLSVGSGV